MRFPTIEARSLEGESYTLPDDLPPGPRVILLPFQRWHQILIEGWRPELERLSRENPSLTFWEVPALSRAYSAGRFYIDGGMRLGIPDIGIRRHTLTAYTDLARLVRQLGFSGFEAMHIFLLDADGEIRWHGLGEMDAAQRAELESTLNTLTGTATAE